MSHKFPNGRTISHSTSHLSSPLGANDVCDLPLDTYASEYHLPVLCREVLSALNLRAFGSLTEADGISTWEQSDVPIFLDCTLGGGGHSQAILQHSPDHLRLFSIDRDPDAIAFASQRLAPYADRWTPLFGNYRDARQLLDSQGVSLVDGLLLDAGVSSHQLDDSQRGFSFQQSGPLDMRMGPDATPISDWLGAHSEEEIGQVIATYGEMNGSFRIARAIKRAFDANLIRTTSDLAEIVVKEAPPIRKGAIHPATLVFQALRIATNDEINGLEDLIQQLPAIVRPGGMIAIISFHSLEDRIVKRGFTTLAADCVCPPGLPICACNKVPEIRLLTRRPVTPQPDEIAHNPRARSAKLRVAQRVSQQ